MKRVARMLVAASLLAMGCTAARHSASAPASRRSASPSPLPSQLTPTPSTSPSPAVFAPRPNAPIPSDPVGLAAALVKVTRALHASIDRWREASTLDRPPREIVLQALYQQRVCRTLADDPKLAAGVLARLPGDVALVPRTVVRSSDLLHSLVRPISKPTAFKTGRPKPAGVLLRYYREAERRFGIRWEVLAAVNYIESKFGRVRSTSYAGAQGPMQFIPSTWAAYGMGGDIQDPHDAILGAANYLRRSGAPHDYRRALYAYNHSRPYVDVILLYARMMERDIRNYFSLYNWQVYVLTTKGAVRITGPVVP
jgi:hypothetical protein